MSIDGNERLSRFVLHRKNIRADLTVRPKAFIQRTGVPLSVFRTSTLPEDEIWLIGEEIVAKPTNRTLYGRSDFCAQLVYNLRYKVEPETSIHPLHADIMQDTDGRDDMLFLANELSVKSKFIPKP